MYFEINNANMSDFKKLKIWGKGMEIVVKTYQLTSKFPAYEKYGLTSQMNRAAVSTPSNIAERSSRISAKEYHYYIGAALGSQYELETLLITAQRLKLASPTEIQSLLELVDEEQKMLTGFRKKLVARSS
jgi:four helix bundle protein